MELQSEIKKKHLNKWIIWVSAALALVLIDLLISWYVTLH